MKKVTFISAQPDDPYFYWQIEVMIHNFMKVGINPNWIETIWATNGTPSKELIELGNKYSFVRFFNYPRTVKNNFGYIPVLRPDVLEQHFERFPNLRGEVIFYHDADVIFRKLPDFDKMHDDAFWYLSDTVSYIGSDYIKSKSKDLFINLCRIVNIDPELVERNALNSGGAQYLMKGVTSNFWNKVKQDCVSLYRYMAALEKTERTELEKKRIADPDNLELKEFIDRYNPIQKWCADMWAVLWNAWKMGHQTKITNELSFSWGTSSLEDYELQNLMHNAGVEDKDRNTLFYKGDYIKTSPFLADFSNLNKNTASYKYVEAILYAKDRIN